MKRAALSLGDLVTILLTRKGKKSRWLWHVVQTSPSTDSHTLFCLETIIKCVFN